MIDAESRARSREIARRIVASPTLPLLGITKTFEALVVGGPVVPWLVFSVLASIGYVFADDFSEVVDSVSE